MIKKMPLILGILGISLICGSLMAAKHPTCSKEYCRCNKCVLSSTGQGISEASNQTKNLTCHYSCNKTNNGACDIPNPWSCRHYCIWGPHCLPSTSSTCSKEYCGCNKCVPSNGVSLYRASNQTKNLTCYHSGWKLRCKKYCPWILGKCNKLDSSKKD